jgi:hypothetical protein
LAKPLKRNSYSFWNTFFSLCQRRAFLDAKFPDQKKSAALERGIRIHNMLEALGKEAIGTGDWEFARHGRKLGEEEARYYKALEDSGILAALKPIEVEQWIHELKFEGETLPWVGKIDLVSATTPNMKGKTVEVLGEPCIVDWKTINSSARILSPWQAQRSLQLRVYSLATGIPVAGFVYLLPSGQVTSVFSRFTTEELKVTWTWLKANHAVLQARWAQLDDDHGNWEEVFSLAPIDNPLCCKQWCPHFQRCLGKD